MLLIVLVFCVCFFVIVRHDITEILLIESGVKHHNLISCISNVDILRFFHMFVVVASL